MFAPLLKTSIWKIKKKANEFFTKLFNSKHIFQVAAKLVNDLGAFCPTYDRPEQGLDLLQEAITNCGCTVGEDFFLAINCAGHELFDYVSRHSISVVPKIHVTKSHRISLYWKHIISVVHKFRLLNHMG